MQKKMEYNGVTFYSYGAYKWTDLDVPDNLTEITFPYMESGFSSYYFCHCTKSFPHIQKLVIPAYVYLTMPNSLFPNARQVIYDGPKGHKPMTKPYHTHPNGKTLYNAFCLREDETADLSGISQITDDAFSGCQTLKFTHTDLVKICDKFAFRGSVIEQLKAEKGSVIMADTILVDIDHTSGSIIIPDKKKAITAIRRGLDFSTAHCLTMHRIQTLVLLQPFLSENMTVRLETDQCFTQDQLQDLLIAAPLELIGNQYYKTIDGVLYTADGRVLVKCPCTKHGIFQIPEGVETIAHSACKNSNIEEVRFPDTMRHLSPKAFSGCKRLKKIEFGNGLLDIGIGENALVFSDCTALENIEVPSHVTTIGGGSFQDCQSLKQIIFHEGLTHIFDRAFHNIMKKTMVSIDHLDLPSTLQYIGPMNFEHVSTIQLHSDNIPYGLFRAITVDIFTEDNYHRPDDFYIRVVMPQETLFVPRAITSDDLEKLEFHLSLPAPWSSWKNQLFQFGINPEMKQVTALAACRETGAKEQYDYLRKTGKNFIKRLVEQNDEQGIVDLTKLGVLTPSAVKEGYQLAKEHGLITAMAYLMDAVNKAGRKKTSFSV